MPSLELEFEVWCSCGNGLCNQTEEGTPRGKYSKHKSITVSPCEACLDAAKEEGHEKGHAEGYSEAERDAERNAA